MILLTDKDAVRQLEDFVGEQLSLLRTVDDSWQPTDFLPESDTEDWYDRVRALRAEASLVSDEVLVVLVGNTVTEEALPSYQTWLNRFTSFRDESGTSDRPWAQWSRGWTAEENRHGDLLNRYLYLSGRVDMRAFEASTQHLIKNGFDPKVSEDPYKALVYTAFQERGTKISHKNTGIVAGRCGDTTLAKICATIAADEARHEEAYKRFFGKILELDPEGGVVAFYEMMKQKVAMPARLIGPGGSEDLFDIFSIVAQRIGVYTVGDYGSVIGHLVDYWKIAQLKVSGQAAKAQEALCNMEKKYQRVADRIAESVAEAPKQPFEWVHNRSV
jgi:acyl-[acyl-carrier-protein] desaturase